MLKVPKCNFDDFFRTATGHEQGPFDYQCRLACGERAGHAESDWLANPDPDGCRSRLIDIPTGLGKTAAVVLAWLWNRLRIRNSEWPRRLVYCLPMRTLVEQTETEARKWLQNLLAKTAELGIDGGVLEDLEWLAKHSPVILMGGEESDRDWAMYPERPAILIGTQDMLLSRALNRGYAMSRYRWPMHFGLLNNDCLWVMDETQLMGAGLATACQLEAFRLQDGPDSAARFNCYPRGRSVTWYTSATANPSHLQTRDWRGVERPKSFFFELLEAEKSAATGPVAERRLAIKRVEVQKSWNFGDRHRAPALEPIEEILGRHKQMTDALNAAPANLPRRTLIICNTVDRAIVVHQATKAKLAGRDEIDLMLMHSRFRPKERKEQAARLDNPAIKKHPGGQIIVATQVIEAGVDLSSAILWTEIAPLACLVQRFGRLNRIGEFGANKEVLYGFTPQAIVVGIDAPDPESKDFKNKDQKDKAKKEAEQKHLPYAKMKCDNARITVEGLNGDASPAALAEIKDAVSASIDRCPYSLQQHELLDFFDTDANLSLGFTDVSPFVRGIDPETDFYVAWRDWPGSDEGERPKFSADFQRQELCPVSIGKARDARALLSKGWVWRGKETGWGSVQNLDVVPGMTILLPVTAGGYREDSGWTGRDEDKPVANVYEPSDTPSDEEMLSGLDHGWRSIAQHTNDVTLEWECIIRALEKLGLSLEELSSALTAAHWHDVGKNHPLWQSAAAAALTRAGIPISKAVCPIAKFSLSESPRLREKNDDGSPKFTGYALKKELRALRQSFKPGLDHEVASALAFRQSEQVAHGTRRPIESLLAEYLIMSHHGRVRKVLRDEIPRHPKNEKDTETVRGISDGDLLPSVTIAGQALQCTSLSTDCRRMGRDTNGNESYTRGVLRLLAHYGPFRLAFFEALFRAADIRASILAQRTSLTDTSNHELDREHPQVARLDAGAQAPAPLGGHSGGCEPEHGFRAGAGAGEDDSRRTRPDRATRFIETTRGVLSYTEVAPLLAERVTRLEAAIYSADLSAHPLSTDLIRQLHRAICGDLVPDWAGEWRNIAVTVGRLNPPPPHQLPMLMLDYALDLQARWHDAAVSISDLTVEFLAFAEGRFLSIHPFHDFNGRTVRVFLLELLRRLDLPRVNLAPQTEAGRAEYFASLEAADSKNWQPLITIWKNRFIAIH